MEWCGQETVTREHIQNRVNGGGDGAFYWRGPDFSTHKEEYYAELNDECESLLPESANKCQNNLVSTESMFGQRQGEKTV